MSTIDSITNVRKNVIEKFNELKSALTMREKLLLRQLDVINNARNQQQQQKQQQQQHGQQQQKEQQQELVNVNITPTRSEVSSSLPSNSDDVLFLCENEKELFENIRNYGRYQITTTNMNNLIFQDFLHLKNEDYIVPNNDHEIFYKDLTKPSSSPTTPTLNANTNSKIDGEKDDEEVVEEHESPETIMVDFSQQKLLMEDHVRKVNESIINITLSEAKELIRKAKQRKEYIVPPLNLEELDDNMESSLAEAVSSLTVSESINESENDIHSYSSYENRSNNNKNNYTNKYSQTHTNIFKDEGKRFKPKITINNCNGTINLRNIAALTINCTTEDKLRTQLPVNRRNYTNNTRMDGKPHNSNDLTKGTNIKIPPESIQYQSALPVITASSSSSSNNHNNNNNISTTSTNNRGSSSDNSTLTTTPVSVSNSTHNNNINKNKNNNNLCSQYKKTQISSIQQRKQPSLISRNETMKYQEVSSTSDGTEATCDFYNRLLNEIKKTIKQNQYKYQMATNVEQQQQQHHYHHQLQQQLTESTDANDIACEQPKRFVLKNFNNLRIILEARNNNNNDNNNNTDDDTFHPVQIEQWLTDIIADTDLEPIQNIDILEYSKIHPQQSNQQQHQQHYNLMMLEELDDDCKQAN